MGRVLGSTQGRPALDCRELEQRHLSTGETQAKSLSTEDLVQELRDRIRVDHTVFERVVGVIEAVLPRGVGVSFDGEEGEFWTADEVQRWIR